MLNEKAKLEAMKAAFPNGKRTIAQEICVSDAITAYISALLPEDAAGLVPVAWRARHSEHENWYLHESPVGWWECQALVPVRQAASLIQSQAAKIAELEREREGWFQATKNVIETGSIVPMPEPEREAVPL